MSAILLFTHDLSAASAEIVRAGGRLLHVLTPSVLVADMPDDFALDASTTMRPGDLDETSVRLADAWQGSQAHVVATEALPWDAPDKEPP